MPRRHNAGTFAPNGFDILIISGSYGGHREHMTDVRRWMTDDRQHHTMSGVWQKLPKGELKIIKNFIQQQLLNMYPLKAEV